jgi:hypothetical protein
MTLSMLKPATLAVALVSALALSGCPMGEPAAKTDIAAPAWAAGLTIDAEVFVVPPRSPARGVLG